MPILVSIAVLFFYTTAKAQAPQSWTSAEMYLAIRKLNVLGSVLYVAAHPDDENTRLITYLSRERMFRTGYLSMTRGDGGQNLIGDEQGIELGLIRTQELLAARRIDGGEQFFTRAYDFGYSKTPEETFNRWNRDKILADVVWVIRKFQPDVIVTRFPATGEGGHGHHTASAILANDAFEAAADPSRFPEQLKFVSTWQVKRILWNTFNFGSTNTIREDQLKIDVGGYNPLLGKSYGEIAAESRSQHKSQGFGVPASRGESFEYFKATKGDQPSTDLMDGIAITWSRVKGGEPIQKMIDDIAGEFDLLHPERSSARLVNLYNAIADLPSAPWKDQKLKEIEQILAQCNGLFLDATTTAQTAVLTDSVRIAFAFNNRLGADIILERIAAGGFDTSLNAALAKNRNLSFSKTIPLPASTPVTQPYWLVNRMAEGYFNVNDQQKIGQPDADPALEVTVRLKINGRSFAFTRPVRYKLTDPVRGELYQPLVILPPAEITFVNENNFSVNDSAVAVQVFFRSNLRDSATYPYTITHSPHWLGDSKSSFRYGTYGNPSNYSTTVLKPVKKGESSSEVIAVQSIVNGVKQFTGYRKKISYQHIPDITYFRNATANLVKIDVKTYNKKIGYITGAGDKVPESLEQMGYDVTLLGDKELKRNDLSRFDAIITGVRAYNTNEWMNTHYDKLMRYVEQGGNLIVQYNTSSNIGPVKAKISPYKLDISRTRVTDEHAPVTFLKPEHPVLNFPNKITPGDFSGWIQERSIYHAANWDNDKFETVIAMSDPGEKPDSGSLVIAKHGKGFFTYTGIVFFRELPAGVPGAYRLLANIIALNRKKGF